MSNDTETEGPNANVSNDAEAKGTQANVSNDAKVEGTQGHLSPPCENPERRASPHRVQCQRVDDTKAEGSQPRVEGVGANVSNDMKA